MPDLFRLKGESYEKEIYIFSKYTIPVQISEAASSLQKKRQLFPQRCLFRFPDLQKDPYILPKTRILPLPLPVSIPVVFREAGSFYIPAIPSTILRQFHPLFSMSLHRYFAVHSPDDVVLWKDGILSFQTMENQPQPLTALCTPDDARDSKIIPFPTLSERQRISQ